MPAPTIAILSFLFFIGGAVPLLIRYFFSMPALSMTSSHFFMSGERHQFVGRAGIRLDADFGEFLLHVRHRQRFCIALFMVAMTSFGVPLGAPTPFQEITS